MEFHILAALFAAAFVNAILPGPCVILTFGRTVRAGVPAGLSVTAGILAGDLLLVTTAAAVTFGLVALAPAGFPVMKWIGIASLIGLAIHSLRTASRSAEAVPARDGAAGFVVGLSSPYNLVFYGALLPQVMPTAAPDAGAAVAMVTVTIAAIATAQAGVIAMAAVCRDLVGRCGRWTDYATAAALLAMAAAAAAVPMGGAGPSEALEVSER
ncbi:MAG: LysE family transporter [Amaricoccus sp.]